MPRFNPGLPISLILMIASGIMITLSLAPFHWWPLAMLSAALVFAVLQHCKQHVFLLSWAYGCALFLSGVSWVYISIHDYGFSSAPLASGLTLLFCVFLGLFPASALWAYTRFLKNSSALSNALAFAAVCLLSDWLRVWVLTGFPWLYPGYAFIDTPLAGLAPVGGVFLLSFICYLSGAAVIQAIAYRQWASLVVVSLSWLSGALLDQHPWTQATGKQLTLAAVQVNIPQDQKWLPRNYQATLDLYESLTVPELQQHDLLIWPEAAIPHYYDHAKPFLDKMAQQAEQHQTALITGIPYRTREGIYNVVMVLSQGQGIYAKQRLVPFGEYLPLEQWLRGLIDFFNLPMSSFSVGPANQDLLQVKDLQLAPYICYEIVYPDFVANNLKQADILFTLSNDAWFGRSIGPKQHFQMVRMRALETGRQIIRSTGTGITAVIDEYGQVKDRIPAFERGVLSSNAHAFSGQTPFTRLGSWPIISLALLLATGAAWRSRKESSRV